MSEMLTKIKKKINSQNFLNQQIKEIEFILKQNHELLTQEEVLELEKEKYSLESQKITSNLSFEQKFNDFIYTFDDINEAKEIEWLIQDIIPNPSIGVFYGNPGTGKSAIIIELCNQILNNTSDVHVIYIDADMCSNKLKQIGISEIIKKYKDRFVYAG